ncbi:MAG: hypothetical protein H7145_07160 [Akkermansiaceae bacterium]|nr:hypothetical protein [Armatimonadota bacterium]
MSVFAIYVGALLTKPRIVPPARPPISGQNGFPLLKVATDKVVRDKDVSSAVAASSEKKWTLQRKRELVAANGAAIIATRNALSFPYAEETHAVSIDDPLPHYKKFRHMARVLVLAGDVAWEEGKQREAVDYYLDAITIGRRVPHRTNLIGRLVGIACEAIGRRAIWDRLERMDTNTTAHCLRRLEALQMERLPFSVTLEEEKYFVQSWAIKAMEDPDRFLEAFNDGSTATEQDKTMHQVISVYGRVVPRKYVADTLGQHMDKVIAQSKKPYIKSNQEIPVPKEIYTAIIVPVINQARLKFVYNETGDALLRTALALRLYEARHGKYPTHLSELVVAKLLSTVPDDPFDMPGVSLHYGLPSTGKYLLYSVGPDGVNDGGKGIESKGASGTPSRVVTLDGKGDMVAGWYRY